MDDELRAKPTPDKNPLLGQKINMLYRLLVQRQSSSRLEDGTPVKTVQDAENDTSISNAQSPGASSSSSSAANTSSHNSKDDDQKLPSDSNKHNGAAADDDPGDDDDDIVDVSEIQMDESASYFENTSMSLQLPIPCTMKQRLLMLNVGDDFSHIWFPTWRKFLSNKRIQNSFVLAKKMGKAFEMSQRGLFPKVFVSPDHDSCIFIGPYGSNDRQNIGLFQKHEKHMVLSQKYYKEFDKTFSKQTKGECFTIIYLIVLFCFLELHFTEKKLNFELSQPNGYSRRGRRTSKQ